MEDIGPLFYIQSLKIRSFLYESIDIYQPGTPGSHVLDLLHKAAVVAFASVSAGHSYSTFHPPWLPSYTFMNSRLYSRFHFSMSPERLLARSGLDIDSPSIIIRTALAAWYLGGAGQIRYGYVAMLLVLLGLSYGIISS